MGNGLRIALLAGAALVLSAPAAASDGLLFHVRADKGLIADKAGGMAGPTYADHVTIIADGARGGAFSAADDHVLAWSAPGNIYAQRGTLSFFWRARTPVGPTEFPLFRVAYADHSSWDMTFLRIDWNGHGFDAFVTDNGLARTRVSYALPGALDAKRWVHIAFSWDETGGVRLYVDGKAVAANPRKAVYDASLDQFGTASRIVGPWQIQSRYSFMRGSDYDDVRIYDHALSPADVASLTAAPTISAAPARTVPGADWLLRYGWTGKAPAYLAAPATIIRKVEFANAVDIKERMANGVDGIRETTWPGVYNRSRLLGRNDYFQLPDWNVYVDGGKAYTLTLPNEPFNRIELAGPADGSLAWNGKTLVTRPAGLARSTYDFAERSGGTLVFTNKAQETPIQEIGAYDVRPGAEPAGRQQLSYVVRSSAAPDLPALDELNAMIAGRYPAAERATVVALPASVGGRSAVQTTAATARAPGLPIVHVLVPYDVAATRPGNALTRAAYGWTGIDGGLDGIAIDLPAMKLTAGRDDLVPLNIRVKDPLWPDRDLIDVDVSVKPGEARAVFLDSRDRILPDGRSLLIDIAAAGGGFDADSLDGAKVRLLFKPRAEARVEHIADRFEQLRSELAWNVEEHPTDTRLATVERFAREYADLIKVDPDNVEARAMWREVNDKQGWPAFRQAPAPAGVPLWAYRQTEDLRLVTKFVNWWIDKRQADYGDFGGGISDDDDLTQQWPPLAMMGVEPDKITRSLNRLVDAADRNGMITNGLGTIKADELHSYEESINARSEAMYINYGDPKAVERLMAVARAYPRIIQTNAAGHTHIVSSYFSGTSVSRDAPWDWSKTHSYLILHPGLLLGDFNGNPATRRLILDLADSYLAHGKVDSKGVWTLPAEINWTRDEQRGDFARAADNADVLQMFWAAWRWTGDEKYLKPLDSVVAAGNFKILGSINESLADLAETRPAWKTYLTKAAKTPGESNEALYAGWQLSGDKHFLEQAYGNEIATANQRMFMMTDAHWWTDRVELFSDLLQRSRMGGVVIRRNQTAQGNTVSWRFTGDHDAEQVAILMPGATRTHFRVIAYNLSDKPIAAAMTGWTVAPGTWRVTSGEDRNGDDRIDAASAPREAAFERSSSVDVTFAPRTTTIYEFDLVRPGTPTNARPDIGIGAGDVIRDKRGLSVTVHSLGSVAAPGGTLTVEDGAGHALATAAIPPLAAPLDLTPKTAVVRMKVTTLPAGASVRIALAGDQTEITQMNNRAAVPTSGSAFRNRRPD